MAAFCHWRLVGGFSLSAAIMIALAIIPAAAALPAWAQEAATQQQQQQKPFEPDSLFLALFTNGDVLIEYDVVITDPGAKEVAVQLFGSNVKDLIVTDLDDKIMDFKLGSRPGEILLSPAGAAGARISYTTPDLVSKEKNVWTLSIDSPISFSVKMPPDSVAIDWNGNPSIIRVGDQTLLTFKAGPKNLKYVIGTLGTEEQANIAINLAQAGIKEAKAQHQDIVLTQTEDLLAKATAAESDGRFADAEKFAGQASTATDTAVKEYTAARKAIQDAGARIDSAAGQGRDVAQSRPLLDRAESQFAAGNYTEAQGLAGQAATSIGDAPQFPFALVAAIVGAVVAGGGGGGAFLFLRRRSKEKSQKDYDTTSFSSNSKAVAAGNNHGPSLPSEQGPELGPGATPRIGSVPKAQPPAEAATDINSGANGGAMANGQPAVPPLSKQQQQQPLPAASLPSAAESQNDMGLLGRIVSRIFEEKPHLRQEDRDVLQFLAEKEGAAFESEVRMKFQLPKTTVWRLVKRLEREELVEIRKAGGQNLIKLRFEGRQP
jgi:uncharacterized membrane protein